MLKLGIGVAFVATIAVGGYFGYRHVEAQAARDVPMSHFEGKTVTIGNDRRGREDREGKIEERPAHPVKVKGFELDRYEVTVEHYRICVKQGGCEAPVKADLCNYHKDDLLDHPMNCVALEEAEAYCSWVDKRVPTEVEFEYAAGGGGKKRLFPWGNGLPEKKQLNACGTECRHSAEMSSRALRNIVEADDGFPMTAPVGSFEAGETSDGVQDLAGNVWEWVADVYDPFAYRRDGSSKGVGGTCEQSLAAFDELRRKKQEGFTGSNPIPKECERVLRGGAFNYHATGLRVTNRVHHPGRYRLVMSGFRCAQTP